jgi:CYTH domain-containing protein
MIEGINENGIEIERKYILKNLPNLKYFKTEYCEAYYREDNGIWIRATKIIEDGEVKKFVQNIKEFISDGTFHEMEKYLTEDEFDLHKSLSKKVIKKTRYFYNCDGDIWEVDKFHDIVMIMAELEVNSMDYNVKIPTEIGDVLVGEVTGNKNYLNINLSNKI